MPILSKKWAKWTKSEQKVKKKCRTGGGGGGGAGGGAAGGGGVCLAYIKGMCSERSVSLSIAFN